MEGWIFAIVVASLALVQALPLSSENTEHKNVKRSAEAVLIGNHQNHERVKKSQPPHITPVESDSKQDTTRDETAKVTVQTNQADESEPDTDDEKSAETAETTDHEKEDTTHTSEENDSDETAEDTDDSTKETEEQTSEEQPKIAETEAEELEELKDELPRLTQKERNEIDLLLSELNLPPTSPLYRDFKRSNKRVARWRSLSRRRRAHASALESSMSLKPHAARSKRETWYPFVVQPKRDDYPDYADYSQDYYDAMTDAPYYDTAPSDYNIPLSDDEAEEILDEIATEIAQEEAAKEAEEAFPIELGRSDYSLVYPQDTPDKRQMMSITNGFKRSSDFYPYQEMDQSPWAAAIVDEAEKRNIQDQYDRLYKLAEALRGTKR